MATVYRTAGGKKLEKFLAVMPVVVDTLDDKCLDIATRAEHNLQQAEVRTGTAHIEVRRGRVDRYVDLVDTNVSNAEGQNSNSALSIEFGREAYVDENGVEWGEMDGLYVLTRAAHLPKKARAKSAAPKVRRRPKRGAHGRFES